MPLNLVFYAMVDAFTGETPNFIPANIKIPLRHSGRSENPDILARTNPAISSATAREFMTRVQIRSATLIIDISVKHDNL
jgi:hypothetical protein